MDLSEIKILEIGASQFHGPQLFHGKLDLDHRYVKSAFGEQPAEDVHGLFTFEVLSGGKRAQLRYSGLASSVIEGLNAAPSFRTLGRTGADELGSATPHKALFSLKGLFLDFLAISEIRDVANEIGRTLFLEQGSSEVQKHMFDFVHEEFDQRLQRFVAFLERSQRGGEFLRNLLTSGDREKVRWGLLLLSDQRASIAWREIAAVCENDRFGRDVQALAVDRLRSTGRTPLVPQFKPRSLK